MGARTESIEIDVATASELKRRAAQRGVSVANLVAELVPLITDEHSIAELDRRWRAVEQGTPTIPHAEVERWMRTWGSPDFRPWSDR